MLPVDKLALPWLYDHAIVDSREDNEDGSVTLDLELSETEAVELERRLGNTARPKRRLGALIRRPVIQSSRAARPAYLIPSPATPLRHRADPRSIRPTGSSNSPVTSVVGLPAANGRRANHDVAS